ncbi:Radical SAM protein [Candidatus Magnetomoraceae bacterium gMMP-1]
MDNINKIFMDSEDWLSAVAADHNGNIFELEGYAAVGRSGIFLNPLKIKDAVPMPYGSELMYLPDRIPILYNKKTRKMELMHENPYEPGKPLFPVAVFNSPGYVLTNVSAFEERSKATPLPLFSYGAAGCTENGFYSSAVQVEWENRQDLRLMPINKVKQGVKRLRKEMPKNRLCRHLENCALVYGCPAGKNFFLKRYEAPLPTSKHCNARCLGCISLQKESEISCSQKRIDFTPSSEEIAEVALEHIKNVNKSVVSFGQGCEGEPLLAFKVIEPAIRMIRSITSKGTINLNTNASMPDFLEKLFDAGLDSIRVSINSVQEKYYNAYFRPISYKFSNVLKSIELAEKYKKFISINYLNCPGFTDSPAEAEAFLSFLKIHPINMIQWRNLNFDPLRYYHAMFGDKIQEKPLGIKELLKKIKADLPEIKYGYFNPPKNV